MKFTPPQQTPDPLDVRPDSLVQASSEVDRLEAEYAEARAECDSGNDALATATEERVAADAEARKVLAETESALHKVGQHAPWGKKIRLQREEAHTRAREAETHEAQLRRDVTRLHVGAVKARRRLLAARRKEQKEVHAHRVSVALDNLLRNKEAEILAAFAGVYDLRPILLPALQEAAISVQSAALDVSLDRPAVPPPTQAERDLERKSPSQLHRLLTEAS